MNAAEQGAPAAAAAQPLPGAATRAPDRAVPAAEAAAPGTAAAAAVPAHDAAAAASAAAAPLQLQIDRLVIDGLPPLRGGERALRAALTQELQQLFAAQPPALLQGGAIARLPPLDLPLPPAADAAALGRALAQALHRSLCA